MAVAKLVVANWKMNGLLADSKERIEKLCSARSRLKDVHFEMVLCPPYTMIGTVGAMLKESAIKWGGQDCHAEASGAYTGDISAPMLKDMGCTHVIVGHSERRQQHKETSEQVALKAKAVQATGMTAIICVGELESERASGQAEKVVASQLKASIPKGATAENTVIAYEPVWAIGTGKTPTPKDIQDMHAFIRAKVSEKVKNGAWLRLLYGGSVKAGNAGDIMQLANVDGVLVGGASLKAEEFWGIAASSAEHKT